MARFWKMHGLGNDFAVFDARGQALPIDGAAARAIADRRTGIGCDQVIVIEPASDAACVATMRIFNPDGSEVEACGNAARCVAALLFDARAFGAAGPIAIATAGGAVMATPASGGAITVDMGRPRWGWRDIPLTAPCDTLALPLALGPLASPVATSMGNPHATFFVDAVEDAPLEMLGPQLERHPIFANHANIGVARVEARDRIRLRVWERGAGLTRACGSAACAALVAGVRRGLLDRSASVVMDGGALTIAWPDDQAGVRMTGPAALSFVGDYAPPGWAA